MTILKNFIIGVLALFMLAPVAVFADTGTSTPPTTLVQSVLAQLNQLEAELAQLHTLGGGGQSTTTPVMTPPHIIVGGGWTASSTWPIATTTLPCVPLTLNLAPGATDATTGGQVSLLQQYLATSPNLYPQGLITGFFGPATEAAIQRLQAQYGIAASGTPNTTGYGAVGPSTRGIFNACVGSGGHQGQGGNAGGGSGQGGLGYGTGTTTGGWATNPLVPANPPPSVNSVLGGSASSNFNLTPGQVVSVPNAGNVLVTPQPTANANGPHFGTPVISSTTMATPPHIIVNPNPPVTSVLGEGSGQSFVSGAPMGSAGAGYVYGVPGGGFFLPPPSTTAPVNILDSAIVPIQAQVNALAAEIKNLF